MNTLVLTIQLKKLSNFNALESSSHLPEVTSNLNFIFIISFLLVRILLPIELLLKAGLAI